MSDPQHERLYNLLPAILRLRDHDHDEVLRALMAVLESEYQLAQDGIDQLYENWFIETCAPDFVPYIGDLVGNRPLHDIENVGRKDVAKTIYYRRRKGTLAVLEELMRDVTGWDAHAVEFFQLLNWTQNLNHQRYEMAANLTGTHPNAVTRVGTANLRDPLTTAKINTPFDVTAHTVDVRDIKQQNGWYNIRNVGIFLWRLFHYPLDDVRPAPSTSVTHGYFLSSISKAAPVFHKPHPEDDDTGLATAVHIAGPIMPTEFYADLETYRQRYGALRADEQPANSDYYGPDRGLMIYRDDDPVPPAQILCKNLPNWEQPPAGLVAIDVERGRMTFAPGEEPTDVRVNTTYGFSGDIGGGPYDRRDALTTADYTLVVEQNGDFSTFPTLEAALLRWSDDGKPDAVIRISDNGTYAGALSTTLPEGGILVIQADNGKRPTLTLDPFSQVNAATGGSRLVLSGLLLTGTLQLSGPLALRVMDCTFVPGQTLDEDGFPVAPAAASLTFADSDVLQRLVFIERSITGAIRMPTFSGQLILRDSIVHSSDPAVFAIAATDDGTAPVPPTTIERCTIMGGVAARELTLASNSIFTAPVQVTKRQQGCVRFSYIAPDSVVPRRYRCQPDLALAAEADAQGLTEVSDLPAAEVDRVLARVRPEFTAEHYGDPAYAQLSLGCAREIKQGAQDGAEMGAFNFLKQPQRQQNLRTRLEEYLVFGRIAGTIYIT